MARPGGYLTLQCGDDEVARCTVRRLPLTLGRAADQDLRVAEPGVSRRHARILAQEDALWIEDLVSRNGTWVNDERVHRCRLRDGDRVRLGGGSRYVLVYREDTAEPPPPTRRSPARAPGTETVAATGGAGGAARGLEALLAISRALNSSLRVADVLQTIVDAAAQLAHADRCLLLLGDEAETLQLAARCGRQTDEAARYSLSVVREALLTRRAQVLRDVAHDGRFAAQESIVDLQLRTVICVPLATSRPGTAPGTPRSATGQTLGVLYLDRRRPTSGLGDLDLELLESFAGHAAGALENARLYEEAVRGRQLEQELALATRIQRTLLRTELPRTPGLSVHAINAPAREVGGDYYEAFTTGVGRAGVALGDVAGKGISAALLMATLQASFLSMVQVDQDVATLCERLNRFLQARTTPERFATFFVAVLSTPDEISYVNAGHNPALLVSASGVRSLEATGLPLGMFPDSRYEAGRAAVAAGDLLVLYSDGVTEMADPQGEEFGLTRLTECVCALRERPVADIATGVVAALESFADGTPAADDVTLLVARFGEVQA